MCFHVSILGAYFDRGYITYPEKIAGLLLCQNKNNKQIEHLETPGKSWKIRPSLEGTALFESLGDPCHRRRPRPRTSPRSPRA